MVALDDLRLTAGRRSNLASSGTCSEDGTTGTLVDARLRSSGLNTSFLQGAWIYRRDPAIADRLRRVREAGFTVATGALAPVVDWADPPAEDEPYETYSPVPPIDDPGSAYSWVRAINEGLAECYFVDEIVIGRGRASGTRRFPLKRGEVTLIATIVAAGGTDVTITPPANWQLIRRSDSGTDVALATYRYRARKTDGLEFTWTFDEARVAAGIVAAYVDPNPDDPVDADGEEATTPASATATAPAVASTANDGRVLRVVGAAGSTSFDQPNGQNEREDAVVDDPAAGVGVYLCDAGQSETGSTGAVEIALGAAQITVAQTIVLQPLGSSREIAFVAARAGNNDASGAVTLDLPRPSSLPNDDWQVTEKVIREVVLRTVDSNGNVHDRDQGKNGGAWRVVNDGPGARLELLSRPTERDLVVISVNRPYPPLSADDDETECPETLAATAAVWKMYAHMNSAPTTRNNFAIEAADAKTAYLREYAKVKPSAVVQGA